jgi:hypothetical protein
MTAPQRARYFFFLSPYAGMAFTRCPECDAKTKQRKLPLVVHVEPHTICVLNKTCRFCPACELVIARQSEIEPLLLGMLGDQRGAIERSDYTPIGTLDREDWRDGQREQRSPAEVMEQTWLFKDHWKFEITGGWQLADHRPPE